MKAILTLLYLILCTAIVVVLPAVLPESFLSFYGTFTFVDSAKALLLGGVLAAVCALILKKAGDEGSFLVKLFLGALLLRMFVAAIIFGANVQEFFGGDAYTYDTMGIFLTKGWEGSTYHMNRVLDFTGKGLSGSGWGMVYLVAALYEVIGRNMFAVQILNAVLGAMTAPLVFLISQLLFGHKRVSRIAAYAVAFFPSLILWSSQGLKDGPIIFLLALSMLATLKLGDRFDFKYVLLLVGALFGLLSMRFYIFYMAIAGISLSFVIGMRSVSAQSIFRQVVVIILLGMAFTYLGVSKFANAQLERYGDLRQIQRTRDALVQGAESGYGEGVDITTGEGAITLLPLGMTYLLFAPFPWQMGSLRALITLPEMVLWWASFPMLITGAWFAITHRFRRCFAILIFSGILTVAYSVFQGNVGTAYRQRSQLLVFYLIFVSVGYELVKEKREDRKLQKQAQSQKG